MMCVHQMSDVSCSSFDSEREEGQSSWDVLSSSLTKHDGVDIDEFSGAALDCFQALSKEFYVSRSGAEDLIKLFESYQCLADAICESIPSQLARTWALDYLFTRLCSENEILCDMQRTIMFQGCVREAKVRTLVENAYALAVEKIQISLARLVSAGAGILCDSADSDSEFSCEED
uniref:Uncharacterized protein n=1 Tax=Timspurckia oligopyrenoides TaxID=708627 RepID=A0A7S0ZD78_9RHOD|mmetsp:Transcript_1328/g.2424  ORF Transcript_1328/g.2424 Transcript_1328/m.2424 type:complete len:175 (+) Transcript_1328:80-604(+)|eukprot:CAMPEP_0182447320 /NCGR_PEP_ID=MMETSP1172-20130603/14541_1 /TAXON_ID=708627 /ORGANISM="Timspurckia oligopyrenoides, Strain CCMP3278" /LENGTH=174 /DNA_ID=CAMNT_0024643713 /DNA_START=57 /DNA_END=581 /DNA_ORIENTATION=+